jgi:uncharacterized protein (TIGR01244 family)
VTVAPAGSSPDPAIPYAKVPIDNVLIGGQLTKDDLDRAAELGYRTVVNLRSPGEEDYWDEEPMATTLGMDFVSIPVAGANGVTIENTRALVEVLDDPAAYPVIVHCRSGNRVGALFAMKAFYLDGKSADEAIEIGRASGLRSLEELLAERFAGEANAPDSD